MYKTKIMLVRLLIGKCHVTDISRKQDNDLVKNNMFVLF